jgi:hypothetical protein
MRDILMLFLGMTIGLILAAIATLLITKYCYPKTKTEFQKIWDLPIPPQQNNKWGYFGKRGKNDKN